MSNMYALINLICAYDTSNNMCSYYQFVSHFTFAKKNSFADPSTPTSIDVDYEYFNVGWGGTRSSNLPYALEADPLDNSLDYGHPNDMDYVPLCREFFVFYCICCVWIRHGVYIYIWGRFVIIFLSNLTHASCTISISLIFLSSPSRLGR